MCCSYVHCAWRRLCTDAVCSMSMLAATMRSLDWPLRCSPLREFDVALFFGLTGSDEGIDPPPVDSSMPNSPPPDPKPPAGSPAGVNIVSSFSPPLHAERNGVGSKKGDKPMRKNRSNPPLPGLSNSTMGSAYDVEFDEDVLY